MCISINLKIITVKSGQEVTLPCRAPNNDIRDVEWSRADLRDEYVLLYQDGQFVPANQHPSFKNRVDLKDRQMKDGDVSLILKDVTINDAGRYKCHIFIREMGCWQLINSISLRVPDPPDKIITAESGQDVTLTCRAPNNDIRGVKWSRAELKPQYVLLYRDGKFVSSNQHPSFKNQVDLKDRQMKDGDVSLILKDVTINDAGRYKCHIFIREMDCWQLINSISLRVADPPERKLITAESGQDVTLTCRAPNSNIVKWSRADLVPQYVFLYRDGYFDPSNQHPSFKNRVYLQDRLMKNGDVSLILKDVKPGDTGTYVCEFFIEETRSWKNSIIYLTVVDPPAGHP